MLAAPAARPLRAAPVVPPRIESVQAVQAPLPVLAKLPEPLSPASEAPPEPVPVLPAPAPRPLSTTAALPQVEAPRAPTFEAPSPTTY